MARKGSGQRTYFAMRGPFAPGAGIAMWRMPSLGNSDWGPLVPFGGTDRAECENPGTAYHLAAEFVSAAQRVIHTRVQFRKLVC